MNLSRAYSLAYGEELSVGRVQTRRWRWSWSGNWRSRVRSGRIHRGRRDISSRGQPEVRSTREHGSATAREQPTGSAAASDAIAGRRQRSEAIVGARATGEARDRNDQSETQRMLPPPLYDLTELQRHANRLFGFSAQKTLELAQALYERHKLISYPRTDSRHLSQDVAETLPRIVKAIEAPLREHLAPGTASVRSGKRFVDDAKVTDHHAIIPTASRPKARHCPRTSARSTIWSAGGCSAAWHDDHIWSVTTVITAITNGEIVDRYHSIGNAWSSRWAGKCWTWRLRGRTKKAEDGRRRGRMRSRSLPPALAEGQRRMCRRRGPEEEDAAAKAIHRSDAAHRDGNGGQNAGRERTLRCDEGDGPRHAGDAGVDHRSAAEARVHRASGKSLEATDKGIRLIEVVHPEVKSPAMTGQWEAI